LPPGILVVSSADNCGPVFLEATPTEFDCDDLGENIVTLIATDPSGNETVEEVIINIVDDVNPELNCPDDILIGYCDPVVEYEISFSDNCELTTEPILTEGLPSGNEFPQGLTAVTYELTDQFGNVETCSFDVIVSQEMTISVITIIDEVGTQMNGSIDVDISDGNPSYTYTWTDSDGNVVSNDEDPTGLSAGEYTLTVIDGNGCTISSSYLVDMVSSTFESELENNLKIYPNPTSGIIFIEVTGGIYKNMEITISDLVGHVFQERNIPGNGKYNFNISDYPSGVYSFKIISENEAITKRVILN